MGMGSAEAAGLVLLAWVVLSSMAAAQGMQLLAAAAALHLEEPERVPMALEMV
jgi:hypothetical protein